MRGGLGWRGPLHGRAAGRSRVGRAVLVVLTVASTLLATSSPAYALPSEVPADLWVANGRVNAIQRVGDFIYIGGNFNRVGPRTGRGVIVDADTGALAPKSPHVDGHVFASAPDGEGGWYIGGNFATVNGTGRTNMAHILADGTVDPAWNPFTDGPVRALALTEDAVILGGDFFHVKDTPRTRLAAVRRENGAPIPNWKPSFNGTVHALSLTADGRAIVGGDFSLVNASVRQRVAAVDAATGQLDPVFAPIADATVSAIDVSPDATRVYLAGGFTVIGLNPRNRIAAVDPATGAVDMTFAASANGAVTAVAAHPDGQRVFVGGEFTRLGSSNRNHLGAFRADGTVSGFAPFATGAVKSITLNADASEAIVGGAFGSLNTTQVAFAGRVTLDDVGTPVGAFDVQADNTVWTTGWHGDDVFLGGGLTSVGSVFRPYLARLHAATGELDTSWKPVPNDHVLTIDSDGSKVYVGGKFTQIGLAMRGRGAAFDIASGGSLTAWNPRADEQVNVIRPAGGDVFVGGYFSALGASALQRHLGKVDADTGQVDTLWSPLPNGEVHDIAVHPSGAPLYVGGRFTLLGATPRKNVAAINPATGTPTNFNPGAAALVLSLDTSPNGNMVFTGIGDTGDNGGNAIAGYSTAGAGSLVWKHVGNGDPQAVRVSDDATVYVGGHFTRARNDNDRRFGLAAYDGPTGALKPWAPHVLWAEGGVWGLDVTPDGLLAAGDFYRIGTLAVRGIALFPGAP